nr:2,4-dihydroxyhept-2-ene-1,7-dioic acid aldolase [uncultured bacterium]
MKRAHGDYADTGVGPYIARANAEVAVMVQIETREALESIAEISAVEGLDCLFIGPQDLSTVIGHVDASWSDEMKRVFEKIAQAASTAGKAWGMQTTTFDQASYAVGQGARYVSCASDIVMLTDRMGEVPRRIREEHLN